MAQTFGFVVSTSDDGQAMVAAEKGSGCGNCSAMAQCHGGRSTATQEMAALNRIGASVGDRVTISVPSGAILSRMAVLYLVPVFGMLAGAFTGAFVFGGADGTDSGKSIILGLAGFAAGLALSIAISRVWSAARPLMPVISRVVNIHLRSMVSGPPAGCPDAQK